MAENKNALAELAERLKGKRGTFTYEYDRRDIVKAQRLIAELAKHNISLIPQECYGCGVLKTIAKCRAIAEGDENV